MADKTRGFVALCFVLASAPALAQGRGGGGPVSPAGVGPPPLTAPSPFAPGAPTTGTGAISGVVIDGATGRPLAEAIVTARIEGRAVTTTLAPRPVGQQITDAKGRFVFTDLAPADGYLISARRAGYFAAGYGAPRGTTNGTRVVLADGEWFSKVQITLWPTAAISGRVLDERGEPVVGAYVRVLRQLSIAGGTHLAPANPVTTDDRGVYRITGLDPGRYLVCAPSVQASVPTAANLTAEPAIDLDVLNRLVAGRYPAPPSSGPAMVYPIACYPDRSPVSQAAPIELDFGADRTNVDIRFQAVPAWRISGRVDGVPEALPGLTVRLLAAGSEELGQGSEAATALVGKDGSFTFLGVPSGQYLLDVRGTLAEYTYSPESSAIRFSSLPAPPRGPGGSSSMSGMDIQSGPPRSGMTTRSAGTSNGIWGQLPVAVDGRDVTGMVLTLRQAVSLTGTLVFDGTAALPAQSPWIFAESADGNPSGYRVRTFGQNMPTEGFVIDGLVPGSYFLRANVGDTWAIRSLVVNGREYDRAPFTLSGTETSANATVTFTDKVITLAGDVRDPQGVPDPTSAVILFPVDRSEWRNFGMTPNRIRMARVTTVGGYRFFGVPAGDYFVVAVDDAETRAWQDPAFFEAVGRVATRVTLGWGESKSVNLVRANIR